MLVHSRWFDSILPEGEDIVEQEGAVTVLNQLRRYAATREITIQVQKPDGTPAANAKVSLEIFNYAEFFPIARLKADENGVASVTTGFGSLHVTVRQDGLCAEALMDTRNTDSLLVTLGEQKLSRDWKDFDVIAPVDTPVNADQPTEEQAAVRDQRLAEAARIRTAKVEAFVPAWKTEFVEKAGENRALCEKLMEVLSEKDRIDAKPAVLKSHVEGALPLKDRYPEDIFVEYVLNPRVFFEVLTAYRPAVEAAFGEEEKKCFRKDPRRIWQWIDAHIQERPELERESVFTTPAAALKLGIGSHRSKKVLFVAIARTLGVPARLNHMDGAMEYLMPAEGLEGPEAYEKAQFTAVLAENEKSCTLTLTEKGNVQWTYMQNWSIARLEEKGYRTMFLWRHPWENGVFTVDLEPGTYRILTGNRLPNGNVFGKKLEFTLEKGEKKEIAMELRDAKLSDMLENIAILPFHVLDEKGGRVQAADLTRDRRRILFWLEVSKEPTEHILNELMERQEEFEKYKDNLLFIVKSEADLNDPTLAKCRETLPGIQVLYDTFTANVDTLGRRMYVDGSKLPLIIVTDGELNGIYATSGYNVGTADMLLRILEM